MSALVAILKARIAANGPMTIAEYMNECLIHPQHGYYTTRDPLGVAGDFTTAPEISQMFGELIGLVLAQAWLDQGAPAPFVLAEPGPGRGTFMADILRATASVPGFHAAADLHLIEASHPLRARQAAALESFAPTWHDHLADLPDGPLFLVANEFFDALPVRQFIRQPDGWCERVVTVIDQQLAFGLTPPAAIGALSHRLADTEPGDLVELQSLSDAIAGEISARIAAHGGLAIIIDYGGWHSRGDTLQALRAHAPVDALDAPGTADLTTHVDFEVIANAARTAGAAATAMTPQGVLLERLGITQRAQNLAASLTGTALDSHISAHRRLTHPQEMGSLFKAIGIHAIDSPPPAGFDT